MTNWKINEREQSYANSAFTQKFCMHFFLFCNMYFKLIGSIEILAVSASRQASLHGNFLRKGTFNSFYVTDDYLRIIGSCDMYLPGA